MACNSAMHEPRHDQLVVEDLGLDDVGDPAVDHDAGVEHEGLQPFDFLGELDVGNDEAEIVVRLHQQADADVAQHHAQRQVDRRHDRPCKIGCGASASPTT